MNKKIIFMFFMLLFSITLISCKDEEEDLTIYEGMVVDKIFDSGYTYITYVHSGKTQIPITHHVPDRYYIVIYKNEQIAKHRVTKSFYNTFDIGSFIVVGEENLDNTEEEDAKD